MFSGVRMALSKGRQGRFYRSLLAVLWSGSSLAISGGWGNVAQAQVLDYCQLSDSAIAQKENLLQASLKGNTEAQVSYKTLVKQHADQLRSCRQRSSFRTQAIWLRVYPCDSREGDLDEVLDRLVNRGYNQVNVEVFYDSQVLLPAADNPTPWASVIRAPGAERVDLLAQAIQKGHERGLRVYAWMFTMNFGYAYAQRSDRETVLARNGRGQNSLSYVPDGSQAFIDPYNNQARTDYYQLVQAIARRRPDGILFDYIRYPRGTGSDSVASKVQDLWIYGEAAQQALYDRATNSKGRDLIQRYVRQGRITSSDVAAVNQLYPNEGAPMWQGRTASSDNSLSRLQWDLWQLSVAHAAQGVLDFLTLAAQPVQRQGISVGTVFFPDANAPVGQAGYDSRLQPWDRFPSSYESYPMAYALCGNTGCIADLVKRVSDRISNPNQITPAIAGLWGQWQNNRPSLEAQMDAIRRLTPQITSISHFAFSWQEPQYDRDRKACRL